MRITLYNTRLNGDKHCYLVSEKSTNYYACDNTELFTGGAVAIVRMMNEVFFLSEQSEEYLYLLCFNNRGRFLGMFEVSHGTHNATLASPREIFQKALLCNATCIIVVHNHPGGFSYPSSDDNAMYDRLKKSGELLGVMLMDSIIIGDDYYSYSEHEKNNLK